ncbi:chaplin [Streptomyces sp. NPDC096068]|uniref:chaplin n=1 Tax=Streptomyces sp. NPDC096068 TaxID=3155424 RepID=UPI00332EDD74
MNSIEEYFSMSRIAKAVVLSMGAAAAVAGTAGAAVADAGAEAAAVKSPGVLSGNIAQVPVHIPVNVCGNTVNVVGVLNPAFGNTCANV